MGTSRAFAHSDIADVRYATVRYMIVTNVNLADILTFLSDDIDDKVRRAVACNLNTPIPACQKLTKMPTRLLVTGLGYDLLIQFIKLPLDMWYLIL